MSAVPDSENAVSSVIATKSGAIEVREGDWKAYLQCVARCKEDKSILDRYGSAAEYKRACAMAYLGKRAQLHGGVCSTRHPHIMTQQFIDDLESTNRTEPVLNFVCEAYHVSNIGSRYATQEQERGNRTAVRT